jgi:hypothetical protein
MSMNRAPLPDTLVSGSAAGHHAAHRHAVPSDTPRRSLMVAGGLVLALVSLAIGSIAIAQVWIGSDAAAAGTGAGENSAFASWEALAMIVLGGLGFAAGAALVGIGMGHWGAPRAPLSDADYTGPGTEPQDMPEPPRVV